MKEKILFLCLCGIAVAFIAAGCGQSPMNVRVQSDLDNLVATQWATYSAAKTNWAGAVALYIMTPKGNYFATSDKGSIADEHVHFRGASTTKSYTAAAIMLLNQQGKLNIDDKVTAMIPGTSEPYLPDTTAYAIPYKDQITIRLLLEHRAGVWDLDNNVVPATSTAAYKGKNYISYVEHDLSDQYHDFTCDELIGVLAADALSSFAPGTSYSYSDTGYSLLAKIIERVSGQRDDQFKRDNLLLPNSLTETSFPYLGNDTTLPAPFVAGYSKISNVIAYTTEDNMSPHVGEGNVIPTLADLANWMRHLINGEAGLNTETVAMMTTVLPTPTGGNYGLGISETTGLGYGHSGAHPGYATVVKHDPVQNVTVAICASIMDYDASAEEFEFLDELGRSAKKMLGFKTTNPK